MAELNGRPVTLGELQTLALTNYGHFTSFRVEDGRVRGFGLHLRRLADDCLTLFGVELDLDRLSYFVRRVAGNAGIATIRVTIFDPSTDLGNPSTAVDPHILVTQRPAAAIPSRPLRVQTREYVREAHEIKSVGLFASLRLRRAAQLDGFDDALFLNSTNQVSEGSTWNVGFFDGTRLIWPEAKLLSGVTMRLLQKAHPGCILPVGRTDIAEMEATFATNAATGIRAISAIDDIEFPTNHWIIDSLMDDYRRLPADLI